jgi:purine-cytosine permease-like protein
MGTKNFLRISAGISIILFSLSLLMFSARENKSWAQTGNVLPSGEIVAGTVMMGTGFTADFYVLGYNPKDGKVRVLGKISPKEMRN